MSVLPRCICDPMEALVGKYDPRCNRHSSIGSPAYDKRVEQLAYVMSFLHSLGFDLETVKRAADAWWAMKATPVALPVKGQLEAKAEIPEWKAEDVAALDAALAKYPPKAACEARESEPGVFLCVPCGGQVGAECSRGVRGTYKDVTGGGQ